MWCPKIAERWRANAEEAAFSGSPTESRYEFTICVAVFNWLPLSRNAK